MSEPCDSWRGRRVDRFEVVSLLGKGANGVVYRARDVVAGRDVALKVLLNTRLDERQRARFRREGELTAALVHPTIVRVHFAGELLGGVPYLAYELVEGARSLADACVAEPDLSRRVAWVRDAARGLGVAHAQGIVHRDVKPDNLLVDREGRLKVADFGAAWVRGGEHLTRTGGLVGTPYFMPPELLSGSPEATPECDVWSLGVTLYAVLTGEYPFDAPTLDALRMSVLTAEPVPLREKNPAVSAAIERVCLQCLEKEPAARYAHGAALADDLDRALAGEPVLAWSTRASRRRALLVAAPLLAVAVAIGWAQRAPPPGKPTPVQVAPTRTPAPAAPVVSAVSVAAPPTRQEPRDRPPVTITALGLGTWNEAIAGSPLFMDLVGDYFRTGEQGFPIDVEEAARWYERGAALGDATCMVDLAVLLFDGPLPKEPARAVALFERAAAANDVWAVRRLTGIYSEGLEGTPRDHARAAMHFERVAQLDPNQVRFMTWGADLYREGGPNLAQDLPRAVAMYEVSVARGDHWAMHRLAQLLVEGRGTQRDLPRARALFERAADGGIPQAAEALRALPPE